MKEVTNPVTFAKVRCINCVVQSLPMGLNVRTGRYQLTNLANGGKVKQIGQQQLAYSENADENANLIIFRRVKEALSAP